MHSSKCCHMGVPLAVNSNYSDDMSYIIRHQKTRGLQLASCMLLLLGALRLQALWSRYWGPPVHEAVLQT